MEGGNYFWEDAIWGWFVVFEAEAIDFCALSISISRFENAKYLIYKGIPLILFDPRMEESTIN